MDNQAEHNTGVSEAVATTSEMIQRLKAEIARRIVGQEALVDRLILALLTNGNVLVEGVPGLAKTMCIRVLASALGADFARIQFTPDLLPADLVGTQVFNAEMKQFETWKGPIFANIILADEINRAPAKVQSGLLEAMQEHQVTIGKETYQLPEPFLVMATQNPLELDGTYPLPEAQVDRFMMKIVIDYPNRTQEREIMELMARTKPDLDVDAVCSLEDFQNARGLIDSIYVDERIIQYVLDLVMATRVDIVNLSEQQEPGRFEQFRPLIECGASPRATIWLTLAAKGMAFLQGRDYVIPDDVKSIAVDVLAHRIIPTYEAEAEGLSAVDLVRQLMDCVAIP